MDDNTKKRVLLVDDEEAIILALKKVLKDPSVEIDTASSVEEAKHLLSQNPYTAVISDLRMSGAATMDGYVVVSEAKKRQPNAKIIVVTAYGGESTKDTVFALGADMYLEKPVSPTRLKEELISMGAYR